MSERGSAQTKPPPATMPISTQPQPGTASTIFIPITAA